MSASPRVLMLMTQLGYGGAETSFIRLANLLAQEMEVTVALFTATYGRDDYASGHEALTTKVVLIDAPDRASRLRRWYRRVMTVRHLKRAHDVTISFLSGPNVVNALAGKHARSVVSLRGSRRYDPVASVISRLVFTYVLDPVTYGLAKWIVPVSPGLMHELPRWIDRSRIVSIPPFIERASVAAHVHQSLPPGYEALVGQPVIIVIGRLSPEKGVQHLLPVFEALSALKAGVKLLLVGDGPSAAALRTQAHAMAMAINDLTPGITSVLFAGYQKHVPPFLALARVLVLASSTEGFPSVLLEAMMAGVPVIANDAPWGARAILQPEQAAKAIPYATMTATRTPYGTLMPRIDDPTNHGHWVQQLLQHLDTPPVVSDEVKHRVDRFSIERVGEQWKALIERVVAP